MLSSFRAGPWLPDLPEHDHDGLVRASGVIAVANGYRPWKSIANVTTALSDWAGGAAFRGSDGTAALLAGGATALYRWTGTAWSSVLGGLVAGRWQFAQFASDVTGVNLAIGVFGDAPVKYDLDTGAAALLGGTPPDAKYICISGYHTVLAGNPASISEVYWSGTENPEIWNGTSLSDSQIIPDDGELTGLSGFQDYFLSFQRSAINRWSYIGAPDTFRRDKISSTGCIAPGSICQADGMTFFLSERGFMTTDGGSVTPIGSEVVDSTFLNAYPRTELVNLTAAVDPRRHLMVVCMPGRLWFYQWVLQRWTDAVTDVKAVYGGFTSNISLDALDALYPGGIDTIPVSLDSALFQGGEPRLYGVTAAGITGSFDGSNLAATFQWPNLDLGQRARIFNARPITDATEMTLTINARARLGDATANVVRSELRPSGHIPIRANGRYVQPRIDVAAGHDWGFFQALDLEYGSGGRR